MRRIGQVDVTGGNTPIDRGSNETRSTELSEPGLNVTYKFYGSFIEGM
jgi:hypothetical protein